ncbi:hypothetical protein FQN57_002808 [Myotisia sp. PD_48]|nr:hypothetical protein FQN57_002808 [Myotisia sp. PD_48]
MKSSTIPPFSEMEGPAPSYEESISSPVTSFNTGSTSKAGLPLLPQHLTEARTYRINSILSTYVDPLLFSQGAAGLYKTTFVLVPSTGSALQHSTSTTTTYSTPQEPQVIGFPSDEVVKLVRLQGEEHAMEFWRQPAVVAELASSMKARLMTSGHKIYQEGDLENPKPTPPPLPPAEPSHKKSFWSKFKGGSDDVIVDRKLGWRAEEPQDEASPDKVPTGMVKVSVNWKETAIRIANDLGLYETKRGPSLCISIEVGT